MGESAHLGGRLERPSGLSSLHSSLSSHYPTPALQPACFHSISVPLPQGHEKCALMILAETQDLGLINATNSALQM